MGEETKYKYRMKWMRKPLEDWLLKQKMSPTPSRQVLQGYIVGKGRVMAAVEDTRSPYPTKVNTIGKLPGYKPTCYGF
jgi:hypothetical protein